MPTNKRGGEAIAWLAVMQTQADKQRKYKDGFMPQRYTYG
jgi:hypothetical protein